MTRVKIQAVAHDQVDPMLDLVDILNIIDRRQKPLVATPAAASVRHSATHRRAGQPCAPHGQAFLDVPACKDARPP
jgi:hypothetical protein